MRRGETLGIVGESGSGKSTVRLYRPTDRSDWRRNSSTTTRSAACRRAKRGATAGASKLFFRIHIARSIPAHGRRFDYRGADQSRSIAAAAHARARELMELQLDPNALDRYPHQFSGGQRQRTASPARWPWSRNLIADEAVSALDVSVQAQVMRLLDDIRQRLNLACCSSPTICASPPRSRPRRHAPGRGRRIRPGRRDFGAPQHPYTIALFEAAPARIGVRAPAISRSTPPIDGDSGASPWHERRRAPPPGGAPISTLRRVLGVTSYITTAKRCGRNRPRRGRDGPRPVVFGHGADDDVL